MFGDQEKILLYGLILVIAAAAVRLVLRKKRNRPQHIHSGRSKRPLSKQSCSYCKKKVPPKELTFYSGRGRVVGVCKLCRPQAERQALLRL
ncbi:hypothetical protein [Paenibacillus naphthalenovorans]|uniref:hypothetical protein n=1 Tax=Paenibacillus naphthalenovorans TaxID=162209 RepID=UPI003D2AEA9D